MKSCNRKRCAPGAGPQCVVAILTITCVQILSSAAQGETIEGFTEAYQRVGVASSESGIVTRLFVREGDTVKAGDPLAVLDDDVYVALLAIARQQAESGGRIQAAAAEVELYRRRYETLSELRSAGQAHQTELERARADLEVAQGRLRAEQEQQLLMQLEYDKAKIQVARRTIRAPLDGKVVELLRQPGEFVSPATPEVMTIVQLDPLRAVFMVPRLTASRVKEGQIIEIRLPILQQSVEGEVEYVSDVVDAQSATVKVKVRIDNSAGLWRSGEKCLLLIR